MIRWMALGPLCALGIAAAGACETRLEGRPVQGGLLSGWTAPGSTVMLDDTPVLQTAQGDFVIGFGRDAAPGAVLHVTGPCAPRGRRIALTVAGRVFPVQRIDGLPPKMVTPDPAVLARIRADAAAARKARANRRPVRDDETGWQWPLVGTVTGVYGAQRILNGQPRAPHWGIDIAAPAGTPVRAPAGGLVTLAHPDMYYSGKTLFIDHGLGVTSAFLHLDSIAVAAGQRVERGDVIAGVGSTGRSTGPHLDWRVNWGSVRLDAALLAGPMPAPDG